MGRALYRGQHTLEIQSLALVGCAVGAAYIGAILVMNRQQELAETTYRAGQIQRDRDHVEALPQAVRSRAMRSSRARDILSIFTA